ncbi:hypothetical protein QAD02_024133 [Eretmocerus hayati]|uniref:Uncharacterized protein n=1 Tax=Eretmocerus hayati TaxID=131215 RepID=A0ACC2PYX7_9HYME|nr:hypothetical protein QAD02_024133 [Eretmocerus hayati]
MGPIDEIRRTEFVTSAQMEMIQYSLATTRLIMWVANIQVPLHLNREKVEEDAFFKRKGQASDSHLIYAHTTEFLIFLCNMQFEGLMWIGSLRNHEVPKILKYFIFDSSGGERALEQAVGERAPPLGQPLHPGASNVQRGAYHNPDLFCALSH